MTLRTRLFFSCFSVSVLLFFGIYLYLKGYNRRHEDERANVSFARSVVHYINSQNERRRGLSQLASLLARDFAFKEAVSSHHVPTIYSALESQKRRAQVDMAFFLDAEGKVLTVIVDGRKPGLDELGKSIAPLLLEGEPREDVPPQIQLGDAFYQVMLAPILAPSHVGTIGIGYRITRDQMARLSDATGLHHVLLRAQSELMAESGIPSLSPADLGKLASVGFGAVERISLAQGNFLVKALPMAAGDSWRLLLLFPLAESELASRELLEAFLLVGFALLLLVAVLSQFLSRQIAQPFQEVQERIRRIAREVGIESPPESVSEIREIAFSYIKIASVLSDELHARQLALKELELYKAELLQVNSRLHTRLFQVKVMLSIWSQQATALDVKEYLKGFLEVLLPGLPFRWGCVVIRPLAEFGADMIFAEVTERKASSAHHDDEDRHTTKWTSSVDVALRDFLLSESQACMHAEGVTVNSTVGKIGTEEDRQLTVASLRLKMGDEPLGSLHFLTDNSSAKISKSFFDFILNLSNQVATQLQIHALSYSARVDPLTRLYNRGYLNDRLREELVRSSRTKSKFSFVLIDVDHFKKVNDTHGHQAGDDVLRGLASLLKKICRGSDAVCRYGGEEIAILLTETSLEGAKTFAENVRKAVESQPFPIPVGGPLKVTVSIGLSEFPGTGKTADELIARADEALYAAKHGGRNCWRAAEEAPAP